LASQRLAFKTAEAGASVELVEGYSRREYRSVAQIMPRKNLHPVKDASLTGCKGERCYACTTERFIPNGMKKNSSERATINSVGQRPTGLESPKTQALKARNHYSNTGFRPFRALR